MRVRGCLLSVLALMCATAGDAKAGRIGPGSLLPERGCTTNFVFRDATDLYVGTAAHCVMSGEPHECSEVSLDPGQPVVVEGASKAAVLAYSSFETMNRLGEKDPVACALNDFALLRIDPADRSAVDPSMPVFGGPVGLRRAPVARGETVLSYGRSQNRPDVEPLRPREGYFSASDQGQWRHGMWFGNPAIFGDSGSAVVDGAGGALGVVTRAGAVETASTAGVVPLSSVLDYMRSHGGPDARLVTGGAFAGATVPELVPSPPSPPEPEPVQPPQPQTPAATAAPAPAAPPAAAPSAKPAAGAKPKARRTSCRKARTRRARRKCAGKRRVSTATRAGEAAAR
jgi:hypothetical protein